jgi:hypothetical protein
MALSIPIPSPVITAEDPNFHLLAAVATFSGGILVYWWAPYRSVILHVSEQNTWYIQEDMLISESLANLMNWDPSLVRSNEIFMYEGRTLGGAGAFVPAEMSGRFLTCEWSDYACEHRPISVTVYEHADNSPPQSTMSLSDDEAPITPPGERRRWRRT